MVFLTSVDDIYNIIRKMLTKNDVKITGFLIRNQQKQFSIREISRKVKVDYKLGHNSIKRLIKNEIITKRKHGKIELCEINLRDNIDDLIQVENIKAKKFLERNTGIRIIIREIKGKIKTPYYSLILFGSYAKGQQHKQSDLDLLVIVPDKEFIKEVEIAINSTTSIKPIKTHLLVMTSKDFEEMLMSKEELNVAKEALNDHIIFYGAEAYYKSLGVL